ncbi:phage cement protein [Xenorhabdus thailandensis]|uniref:gp53 minor capsid family protein n=1 Tax=Xenorhabdus thailandensis TaxID=3136255 RepID=UPI0030F46FB2
MTWKRTSQGYVVTTARITRAGPVQYYGHEIGLTGKDINKKITIHRTLEELSKPETLKSFDGLTLTLTHPDSGEVNADEWKDKTIGHIQNIRADGNYLVCDAYLKDANAIQVLEEKGIRELLVGYEPAELIERNGELYQINIRGNHVAVVAEGRLGDSCRLNDKKGNPMSKTLKDIITLLKGKRVKDAEGQPLTEDELIGMIAVLEKTLQELEGNATPEATAKAQEIVTQLAELKAQLEASKGSTAPPPTDADPNKGDAGGTDDKEACIAALEAENEQLKTENTALKEELEKLKGESEASSTLNDEKSRFPKVNFNDAKSARDVRTQVLLSTQVFTDAQVKAMTDEEIGATYTAIQATSKPRSNIGHLLVDSAPVASSSNDKIWGEENLTDTDLLYGTFAAVNPDGGIKGIEKATDQIHGIIVRDIYGDKAPHSKQVNVGHFSHGDCVAVSAVAGDAFARGDKRTLSQQVKTRAKSRKQPKAILTWVTRLRKLAQVITALLSPLVIFKTYRKRESNKCL